MSPAVARVLERITASARRHRMFEPRDLVLVSCSGGPDSTCLLHALHRLRRLLRIRLAVFHFDHRLRVGSDRDAGYVRRQAERLGLPVALREADGAPAAGQSVEAWARLARYAALTQVAADLGAQRAALDHTLDDQAETVLLGLVRGGGIEAAAGIRPVAVLPPLGLVGVRPLLEVSRREVRDFCGALHLRPREDPTNRDRRFLRNRVRLEVLPFLERTLDRGVKATLARTAEHLAADADYLERLASEAAMEAVHVGEDEIRMDARALAALPGPVAARVVRQALRLAAAAGGEWDPDATAAGIVSVLDLAGGRPGRQVDLPGALLAERGREYVRVARTSPEAGGRKASKRAGRTGRARRGKP